MLSDGANGLIYLPIVCHLDGDQQKQIAHQTLKTWPNDYI